MRLGKVTRGGKMRSFPERRIKPDPRLVVVLVLLEAAARSGAECGQVSRGPGDKVISSEVVDAFQVPFFGAKDSGDLSEGAGARARAAVVFREDGEGEEDAARSEEARARPGGQRYEEIKMLNAVQRIKDNRIAEAPRGVQDQFIEMLGNMIPQSCWYKGVKFDCGLSISCVLAGGKPLDLCSGGMIWSCCVSPEKITTKDPNLGTLQNASMLPCYCFKR